MEGNVNLPGVGQATEQLPITSILYGQVTDDTGTTCTLTLYLSTRFLLLPKQDEEFLTIQNLAFNTPVNSNGTTTFTSDGSGPYTESVNYDLNFKLSPQNPDGTYTLSFLSSGPNVLSPSWTIGELDIHIGDAVPATP